MAATPPPFNNAPMPAKTSPTLWVILAVAGCGGTIFVVAFLAAILFPVFAQARQAARRSACLSNVKQLALGELIYSADNNDSFPSAKRWTDASMKNVRSGKPLFCPAVTESGVGYAMSDAASEKNVLKVEDPEKMLLLFESEPLGPNAHGTLSLAPRAPRHGAGKLNVAYVDGHARTTDLSSLK